MDLEVGEAVDDVHARLLERARPLDVPALVEAGLELDEADALLAGLGRLDQGRARAATRRSSGRRSSSSPSPRVVRRRLRRTPRSSSRTSRTGGGRGCRPRAISANRSRGRRRRRSRAGVRGTQGSSFRSGRSSAAICDRSARSSSPWIAVDLLLADAEPAREPLEHPIATSTRRPRAARRRRSGGAGPRARPPRAGRRPRRRPRSRRRA